SSRHSIHRAEVPELNTLRSRTACTRRLPKSAPPRDASWERRPVERKSAPTCRACRWEFFVRWEVSDSLPRRNCPRHVAVSCREFFEFCALALFWSPFMPSLRNINVLAQAALQSFEQFRLHELVIIRHVQAVHRLAGNRLGKSFAEIIGVLAFHDENHVGPAEKSFRDANARARLSPGG